MSLADKLARLAFAARSVNRVNKSKFPPSGCDLCKDAGSGMLFLHAKCHMTAPLQAVFEPERNTLVIRCYVPECNREVARFQVLPC